MKKYTAELGAQINMNCSLSRVIRRSLSEETAFKHI